MAVATPFRVKGKPARRQVQGAKGKAERGSRAGRSPEDHPATSLPNDTASRSTDQNPDGHRLRSDNAERQDPAQGFL